MFSHLLELLGLVRTDGIQQGWAVAVPIVASVISGVLGNKGKKAQQKAAEKASAERRAYAMAQLSPYEISRTAEYLFPGLLPPTDEGKPKDPAAPQKSPLFGFRGQRGPGTSIGARRGHTGGVTGTPGSQEAKLQLGLSRRSPTNPNTAPPVAASTTAPAVTASTPVGNVAKTALKAMPKRAQGGPLTPGQPTVVGEQGPEVIMPGAPGQVLPNPGTNPVIGGGGGGVGAGNQNQGGAITGLQGGAELAPTPQQTYPGSLVMGHMMDYLQNPGQLDSSAYEREQEQVNQGLNYAQRGIAGGLTGAGVDPNSGYGQMLSQSAALNAMKMKNEANRDFTQMSETLRRADIDRGTQSYLNFLSTVFGVQNARANTATSAGSNIIPQFGDPYAGWASAVGVAGNTLSQYFQSKNTPKTGG